ncbi:probable G-protein coupled receptor Mth-like 4 isoform X2 [Portunus trituberculatus]|uniref:probable G-protein coupled receptor Mth-like 4 isoform X2 n=1 Tax=Portunus trituberculatus TaxID=210409 RepID=UPI001E1D2159|nr:probable G-protein coupled receptor Mth-like 4 isoform X2 [Portunus trituberculatus]
MQRLISLAGLVMVAVAAVEGSSARPGLSWCSESTIDNMKITKDKKPELGQIEVVVKEYIEQNVVEEVFIRKEPQCEGITKPQTTVIDWENAELVKQDDGNISLFWKPPDTMPIFQEVDNFCITNKNPQNPEEQSTEQFRTLFAKFCFPDPFLELKDEMRFCSDISCVRKCCPEGMSLISRSNCGPVDPLEEWLPDASMTVLYGPPRHCADVLIFRNFSILPSGIIDLDGGLQVNVDSYCVEQIGNPPSLVAMSCANQVTSEYCEWRHMVLRPVLQWISVACLILVLIVYVSVARLRSLNEGRSIISLVIALGVAYACLNVVKHTIVQGNTQACEVAARLAHFGFLASYFWMNVISFHTFVKLRSPISDKWEKPLVFSLYSLYAWGVPLAVAVVGAVLDAVDSHAVRPHFENCWFQDTREMLAYMYIPMMVVICINFLFFLGCVVFMCRRSGRVTFSPSSSQHSTFSAWLYVRLFILTGILWHTEVVAWYFFEYCSILEWTADILNSLHGVFVFIVTICFRKDLKVFHCGRPKLVQKGRQSEITTTEASEMAANPLVS